MIIHAHSVPKQVHFARPSVSSLWRKIEGDGSFLLLIEINSIKKKNVTGLYGTEKPSIVM